MSPLSSSSSFSSVANGTAASAAQEAPASEFDRLLADIKGLLDTAITRAHDFSRSMDQDVHQGVNQGPGQQTGPFGTGGSLQGRHQQLLRELERQRDGVETMGTEDVKGTFRALEIRSRSAETASLGLGSESRTTS